MNSQVRFLIPRQLIPELHIEFDSDFYLIPGAIDVIRNRGGPSCVADVMIRTRDACIKNTDLLKLPKASPKVA